jgi:SP family general alpha glucoside:H+ symporter-like MFS transporter
MERYEEAEKALYRLARKGHYTPEQMRGQLALMKYTNEKEKAEAANSSYWDCFRGTNLRRTEIVCMTFLIQTECGQAICSYATVFLKAAGMAQTMAFNYSMAIQSTNIVATGIAIYFMGRLGRRTFYMAGVCAIGLFQMVIGIIGVAGISKASEGIAVAVMMILINLTFKLSLGPACYTIIGEMPNSRVRAQSVVLARTTYIIGNTVNGQIIPRQLNVKEWNWGAKCGWYWMGLCALGAVYTWFRIPESRNRTFLELDHLFAMRVPARKFSNYHIDSE